MNKLQKASKMLSEVYDMSSVTLYYEKLLFPEKAFYVSKFGETEKMFIGVTLEDVRIFVDDVKAGDYYG